MTTGEHQILTINILAKTMNHVMSKEQDKTRFSCVERTGMLITMQVLEEYDKKIRPQDMEDGSLKIPKDRALLESNYNTPNGYVGETGVEVSALAEEQQSIDDGVNDDDSVVEAQNEE